MINQEDSNENLLRVFAPAAHDCLVEALVGVAEVVLDRLVSEGHAAVGPHGHGLQLAARHVRDLGQRRLRARRESEHLVVMAEDQGRLKGPVVDVGDPVVIYPSRHIGVPYVDVVAHLVLTAGAVARQNGVVRIPKYVLGPRLDFAVCVASRVFLGQAVCVEAVLVGRRRHTTHGCDVRVVLVNGQCCHVIGRDVPEEVLCLDDKLAFELARGLFVGGTAYQGAPGEPLVGELPRRTAVLLLEVGLPLLGRLQIAPQEPSDVSSVVRIRCSSPIVFFADD